MAQNLKLLLHEQIVEWHTVLPALCADIAYWNSLTDS